MSDLLSASSLLMAIAAILFSLWYAEISKALNIKPNKHKEDNIGNLQEIKGVIFSKSIPVTLMSTSVALIFLPDSIKLTLESITLYKNSDLKSTYDAVKTAYCFVSLLSLALAIYMIALTKKLMRLKKKLEGI